MFCNIFLTGHNLCVHGLVIPGELFYHIFLLLIEPCAGISQIYHFIPGINTTEHCEKDTTLCDYACKEYPSCLPCKSAYFLICIRLSLIHI